MAFQCGNGVSKWVCDWGDLSRVSGDAKQGRELKKEKKILWYLCASYPL